MPASFSRTMRSLNRDHFRPTVIGVLIALCLLLAWGLWFFFSELTLYEVSEAARIVEGREVLAEFPVERSLGRIHPGQTASLRLDAFSWVQYGALEARVRRVQLDELGSTVIVELQLNDLKSFPVDVEPGSTGTVEVEVERISPAALVLRAAGRTAASPDESRSH